MRIAPARRAALRFLARLGGDGREEYEWDDLLELAFADPLLADARDRRLFSQLVAGVVRLRGRLDARLLRLTGRPKLDPLVRDALRLALYQLEEMDRLPAHAVIGESVEWVKRRRGRKLAGWTNAQLRSWQREGLPGADPDPATDPLTHAVENLSYPEWLAERWLAEFGTERALALMEIMNRHPGPCFRWNALRPGREEFLAELEAAGATPLAAAGLPLAFRIEGAWPPLLRPALERGDISVQEAASQRVAPLLTRGEEGDWADLCAAPGGKCCHLAELGGDRRELLALDRDAGRLEIVVANAERLGLSRMGVECGDLRRVPPRPVDGVLLDSPCTALGVLAANPDARWRREADQIGRLAGLQRELLDAAARWPRPGGRLIYSVCTLTPEETVEQREGFLERNPDFILEPFSAEELPATLLTADGDYLVLPVEGEPVGFYAFRCRRKGETSA
jgi:16S rRNA (cytosine967-C5)-methyltransferase